MKTENRRQETPLLGYVVVSIALIIGTVAATAFGQSPRDFAAAQEEQEQLTKHSFVPAVDALRRRWILGVQADATATGYLIRQVQPRSAASRIGLEPGDRIIAVDGLQVGLIGHRLQRLGAMLERQGGADGHVCLLLQNRRNGRLVALSVQLRHPLQHLGHE